MSTWRRKAIECLPEERKYFEEPGTSIYTVFSELLGAVVMFHRNNNVARLQSVYDFAEWCFRQKNEDIWNAAGVSFYEHLVDYPETRKEMKRWMKQEIYTDIRGLLEYRLTDKEFREIDNYMRS